MGLVLLGVAARIAFYASRFGNFDSDEAVGGLMARELLDGHVTTFYWGQAYGGPFETWLAAPFVGLFGSSWLSLRIVPICLSALTAVVVWRIGLRTISRPGALTAAALVWFFPTSLLWRTNSFFVIYAGAVLLGALVVLQVLRAWSAPSARGMLTLGLLAGFALWQSFQLATIIPAAVVWLLVRRPATIRLLPVLLGGALLGFAPVLVSNVRHDWWSRHIGHNGEELPYLGRLWQFFTNGLPFALDLRVPVTLEWFLWKPLALVLYAAVLLALLWRAWSSRARREQRASELLLVILIAFPLVYATSPLTTFKLHGGYVVVLTPVLLLGACAWIRSEVQAAFVSVVALAFLAHSFVALGVLDRNQATAEPASFYGRAVEPPRDFQPLVAALDRLGISRIYASYWLAYRITYESGGRIVASDIRPEALRIRADGTVIPLPDDPFLKSRHPGYADVVAEVTSPAFVLARGFEVASTDYGSLEYAKYRTAEVGPFTIYYRGDASRGTGTSP